ncbi:MAG: peptide chain release factor H [Sphingobacteriales bacterium]|nr:MAG: peptide chain release factor H [Sphingobacteriales bacterium]
MEKVLLQITSGRGPVECCRVVTRVVSAMITEARSLGIVTELVSAEKADLPGTMHSATLLITGRDLSSFAASWAGTILWTAKSPYRPMNKRKNWYAGVSVINTPASMTWNERDLKFETTRASGPGGQHVNKVETAVRATHLPSGLQVLAMDSRSQLQNRKMSVERLKAKFDLWINRQMSTAQQSQWQEHNVLERGNPVRSFKERL